MKMKVSVISANLTLSNLMQPIIDTHKPTKCSIGVQASPECASFAVQASPPTSSSGVQATSTLCLQLSQATPIVFDASVSTYTSTESVAVQATSTGNGLGFTPTSSDHTNSTLVDILPDSGSIKGEALPPFYVCISLLDWSSLMPYPSLHVVLYIALCEGVACLQWN